MNEVKFNWSRVKWLYTSERMVIAWNIQPTTMIGYHRGVTSTIFGVYNVYNVNNIVDKWYRPQYNNMTFLCVWKLDVQWQGLGKAPELLQFTDRCLYTRRLSRKEAFTHRNFYTPILHTNMFLHSAAFTHRRLYTQTLLHKDAFAQKLLHRETFAQNSFTQRSFPPPNQKQANMHLSLDCLFVSCRFPSR